jgi:hypothetical protein
MNSLLLAFWATLIFASIGWYGFLVFYVGWTAGREIRVMTRTLAAAANAADQAAPK